jgi:nucleotide-binding universal stress UspA family protein
VNMLAVLTPGPGRGRRTYLLAGSVAAQVLHQAGAELLAPQPQVRP